MSSKTFIPQHPFRSKFRRVLFLLNIVSVMVFAASCGKRTLTDKDVEHVRQALDASIDRKDATFLSKFLDPDAMAERVAAHMRIKPDLATKRGIRKGVNGTSFAEQVLIEVRKGGSYRFVRSYTELGRKHMIYRLHSENGLNYHDWELIASGSGVKAADFYMYFTGETMSRTMADLVSGLDMQEVGPRFSAEIAEVRRLMNSGQIDEAMELFESWPPNVRRQKLIRMMELRLKAASNEDEAYVAALEQFANDFPESKNIPLMMIDAYLLRKDYDRALSAVDKLDEFVQDPFLNYYRGLVSKMSGDTAAYAKYVGKAYESSSDVEDVVIEMYCVRYLQGDKAGAESVEKMYLANHKFNAAKMAQVKAALAAS